MIDFIAIYCKNLNEFNYMQNFFVKKGYGWLNTSLFNPESYNINIEFQDCERYFKNHSKYYLLINKENKRIDAIYEFKIPHENIDMKINKIIDSKILLRKEKLKKINSIS